MKIFLSICVLTLTILLPAFAAEKPSSVIHVVTLAWNEGTSPEKIQEAMKALEDAAKMYPGITRIWVRPISVQGGPIGECEKCTKITHAFVMEFASEDALKKYRNSDAQKLFYKTYIPLRLESRTHDITN